MMRYKIRYSTESRYKIMYGPEILNEFEFLDDALEMALEDMKAGGPTLYVYDAEDESRYDVSDGDWPQMIADIRDDSWKVYPV